MAIRFRNKQEKHDYKGPIKKNFSTGKGPKNTPKAKPERPKSSATRNPKRLEGALGSGPASQRAPTPKAKPATSSNRAPSASPPKAKPNRSGGGSAGFSTRDGGSKVLKPKAKPSPPKPKAKPKRSSVSQGERPPSFPTKFSKVTEHKRREREAKKNRKIVGHMQNLDGSNRTPVYEPDYSKLRESLKKKKKKMPKINLPTGY